MYDLISRNELIIDLGFSYSDIMPTRDELISLIKRQPAIDSDSVGGRYISKRPTDVYEVKHDIYKCGKCPECGEGVSSEFLFCSTCGQRLDWQ